MILTCTNCDAEVDLPPVLPPAGAAGQWVSIENMDGWTAPPLRCPACGQPHAEPAANGRPAGSGQT